MDTVKRVWNSPYLFWMILAIPSVAMLSRYIDGASAHRMLHPTGEFAARFMILAMMITPLWMLFKGRPWIQWLLQRRRYLGVAAFGYALLHTVFYLIDIGNLPQVLTEALELSIWTGWLAFFIFVPLALTSNRWGVRRLGNAWKSLQRLVYAAALLTVAHWIFLEYEFGPALAHFLPLAALEAYRVSQKFSRAGGQWSAPKPVE